MAPKKHVHKYHRIKVGFGNVWSCALPKCGHFMPRNLTELVNGRASLCWKCDEEFILNEHNMMNDKPVCVNCDAKANKLLDALDHFGIS